MVNKELQDAVVEALRKAHFVCMQKHHETDFSLAQGLNNCTFDVVISPDGDLLLHCDSIVIYCKRAKKLERCAAVSKDETSAPTSSLEAQALLQAPLQAPLLLCPRLLPLRGSCIIQRPP